MSERGKGSFCFVCNRWTDHKAASCSKRGSAFVEPFELSTGSRGPLIGPILDSLDDWCGNVYHQPDCPCIPPAVRTSWLQSISHASISTVDKIKDVEPKPKL